MASELAGLRWYLSSSQPGFVDARIVPNVSQTAADLSTVISLVGAQMGVDRCRLITTYLKLHCARTKPFRFQTAQTEIKNVFQTIDSRCRKPAEAI